MKIAYSPCPNDTFVFHAWSHGLIEGAPELEVTYADIDITNGWAADRIGPEVMKISYAALPWVLEDYALIPCGGALGRGCGPLVLTAGGGTSRSHADAMPGAPIAAGGTVAAGGTLAGGTVAAGGTLAGGTDAAAKPYVSAGLDVPYGQQDQASDKALVPAAGSAHAHSGAAAPGADPSWLSGKRVAVPSERSTAYLLFRLWAAQNVPGGVGEIVVMPFHEIMPAVRDGRIDAGLVIHEARFTYPEYGLSLMADMGAWWEADTGLPIPLGAIIAKRSLDRSSIEAWARSSVEYAWEHPAQSADYVRSHAQEMSPEVTSAHIALYVNEFTRELGEDGYNAVESLLGRAAREGLVPEFDLALLRK